MKKYFRYFILIFLLAFNACTDFADVFGARPEASSSPVLRVDGTYYIVSENDTMQSVAKKYDISAYQLSIANGLETDDELVVGQKLLIPKESKTKESIAAKKREAKAASKTKSHVKDKKTGSKTSENVVVKKDSQQGQDYIWPVKGTVTSLMGPRRGRSHDGIDISAPFKAPISAVRNGTVIFAGKMSAYGNLVIIKHTGNIFSAYAHLSEFKVDKDKKVKQGELIGLVGRTGRASATHLHFEIRSKTQAMDPMKYLPPKHASQIKNLDTIEE